MTLFILTCAVIGITAVSAFIFDFDIDDVTALVFYDEDLREAMKYEATMDATAKAIKGHSND